MFKVILIIAKLIMDCKLCNGECGVREKCSFCKGCGEYCDGDGMEPCPKCGGRWDYGRGGKIVGRGTIWTDCMLCKGNGWSDESNIKDKIYELEGQITVLKKLLR